MSDDLKELRDSESPFPVDVVKEPYPIAPIGKPDLVPHRLDAYQLSGYDGPTASFGMSQHKTAEILRDMANRIESGEYLLQSAGILSRAEKADYHMTYFTLEFHQKKSEEAR